MSAASDFFAAVNSLLRGWGYPVEEQESCWSRSNGTSWASSMPVALTNHHFVIPLSAAFESGAQNVTYGDSTLAGPKANWYGGIDAATGKQRLRFISVGPANHAGMGRVEVLNRLRANQAPLGWAAEVYGADNWGSGNQWYAGVEWHHPGDSTPWAPALLDLVTALNAAAAQVSGWPAERSFMHAEHSYRKIDMSWLTDQGGFELRRETAARLTGTPTTGDWWDTVDEATARTIIKEEAANAVRDVLGRGGLCNGLYITDVLTDVWNRGKGIEDLVKQVANDEANDYDAVIYQDGNGLWLSEGGESTAIPDPDTLGGIEARLKAMGKKILYWPGGDVDLPGAFGRRDSDAGIPGSGRKPATTSYTVASGDTLRSIADKFSTTVEQLMAWNPALTNPDQITVGQVLQVSGN